MLVSSLCVRVRLGLCLCLPLDRCSCFCVRLGLCLSFLLGGRICLLCFLRPCLLGSGKFFLPILPEGLLLTLLLFASALRLGSTQLLILSALFQD